MTLNSHNIGHHYSQIWQISGDLKAYIKSALFHCYMLPADWTYFKGYFYLWEMGGDP